MLRYCWLLLGAVASLFAVHSSVDIPLAAWIAPAALICFARLGGALAASAWMWLVAVVASVFWLWQTDTLSPPLLVIALLLGTAAAVPFVLDRWLAPRLADRGALASTLVFPAAKVATEFALASASPVGAIYGVAGVTQHDNLALIQTASVTGVYGVSFLVAWFGSAAAHALTALRTRGRYAPRSLRPLVVFTAVLGCVLLAGGARLAFAPSASESVRVAGVTLSEKSWDAKVSPAFEKYDSLSAIVESDPAEVRRDFAPINAELLESSVREAKAGARLVVWTESAGFTLERHKDELVGRAAKLARAHGVHLQIAISVYTDAAPNIRNQAILITDKGEVAWTYDKAHPIPVLEPYDAGSGVLPVHDTPFGRLSTAICFDVNFPGMLRQAGEQRADVVLLPSNEWDGIRKFHAENAVFRAVEGGYTLVRPVSRGVQTVVDQQGRVVTAEDYFASGGAAMVASVPAQGTVTVYSIVGDAFAWACVAATAAAAIAAAAMRARQGARAGRGGPAAAR